MISVILNGVKNLGLRGLRSLDIEDQPRLRFFVSEFILSSAEGLLRTRIKTSETYAR